MSSIAENLGRVREQIASATAKSGRSADDVELVAITKTHPAESVREAIGAGQILFGESRVQEARAKIPELPSNLRWHFVGHLQKNKIRHALPLFEMFHGIDSLELARDINRIAQEDGAHPCVLLQVNVAGEGSKFGFSPGQLHVARSNLDNSGRCSQMRPRHRICRFSSSAVASIAQRSNSQHENVTGFWRSSIGLRTVCRKRRISSDVRKIAYAVCSRRPPGYWRSTRRIVDWCELRTPSS